MQRRLRGVLALATLGLSVAVGPAAASAQPVTDRADAPPLPTRFTLKEQLLARPATGKLAPTNFNPLNGYPATAPPGSVRASQGPFQAGIYEGVTPEGRTFKLYCVDAQTQTSPNLQYVANPWATANLPNLGYVARILEDYYPNTARPYSLPSAAHKAAAVQLAIWFFTNRLIVDKPNPLLPAIEAIVGDAINKGPRSEPPPPRLKIDGPRKGEVGKILGPFTVNSTDRFRVLTDGVEIYTDPAGRKRIPRDTEVPRGTKIYLKLLRTGTNLIKIRGLVQVRPGTVVVYTPRGTEPSTPAPLPANAAARVFTAQTMVLASPASIQMNDEIPVAGVFAAPLTSAPAGGGAGGGGGATPSVSPSAPGGGGSMTPGLPVTSATETRSAVAAGTGVLLFVIGMLAIWMAARWRRRQEAEHG